MSKSLLVLTAVAATCVSIASASAARAPAAADPLRSASLLLQSSKMMSPVKRTRVADSNQCSGQTKPIVACACEATDANGNCTHEVCDTVCPGNDSQED